MHRAAVGAVRGYRGKERGRIRGLPEPLPTRRGRRARRGGHPKSESDLSRIFRSRFLPRGSACGDRASPPGSRHSPPRSPQPNMPANSGRWPAPPAPAPTPSSLLLPPSADAATAAPRAATSPQPRRSISPLLPQAVGPESTRRRRVAKAASSVRSAGREGRRPPARPPRAQRPRQVTASSLPRGRTQKPQDWHCR